MKKVIPVVLAAMLAIGFSAFTPSRNGDVFYKQEPGGTLLPTTAAICENIGDFDCRQYVPEINQEAVLYHANGQPYKWNGSSR